VMWAEGKVFATPMQGRLRCAGTVELAGLEAPPDWRRADMLLGKLREIFPAAEKVDVSTVKRWQGFRPSTPDSLPVLDTASRVPNAFYAFGHGHVGLAAAANTGRAMSALVTGQPAPFDLAPFSVKRFR
jgi:glycine/D-amino acid oxidase-like deaminating enzyme